MFLQRYKHSHERNLGSPTKQIKFANLIKVLKNGSIPQIKKHEKKTHYFNPRTYLIENAKKVIKTMKKDTENTPVRTSKNERAMCSEKNNNLLLNYTQSHITSRDARKAAIKKIHQRIWKSNDLGLLRGRQERRLQHSKTSNRRDNTELVQSNFERIPYVNFIEEFDLSFNNYRKQSMKMEGLAATNRYRHGRKDSRIKNPEQTAITSAVLNEQIEDSSLISSYKLLAGERRKQVVQTSHLPSRPNTTGGHKHQRSDDDQNIIEPW